MSDEINLIEPLDDGIECEIINDTENSSDITDDDSVAYESWAEYEAAVTEGKEKAPPIVKHSPRHMKYSFNIDEALDSIDLSFPNYTPSKDAFKFFNIIRMVMGEDPETDSALVHYFLVDLIFGNVTREMFPYSDEINQQIRLNPKMIAIIASRFTAKSTVITAFMPIYCAVTGKMPGFGNVMFWVSFGDSQQAGAKVQANTIRDICEESVFCKEYFEKMRFTDEECEFVRKGTGKIKDRAFMFKVKGAAGGSVRGIRYKTERPQIFTFDDIIKTEADANSEVIMAKLKSMIYSDASNATGKRGKIIIVNTPFNKKDPVYSALESGIWTPLCIPQCEKIELGMKKSDYRGSWEAMKSFEDVMEDYENAYYGDTLREFNQERMLRIASAEERLIKPHQFERMWYSRKGIEKHLSTYNLYATTDYTASNETRKGDFSGTAIWAVNNNDDWFLLDLSLKRQGIEEQYGPIMNMTQKWGNKIGKRVTVGVEIDGQQQINIYSLQKLQREKNIYFNFAKQIGDVSKAGKNPEKIGIARKGNGTKHDHFMRAHPMFQNNKIFFPEELRESPDMKELINELEYVTWSAITSKHDDGLDLISMIPAMEVFLPLAECIIETGVKHGNTVEDPFWGNDEYENGNVNGYSSYS